jgi:hypothetical protein
MCRNRPEPMPPGFVSGRRFPCAGAPVGASSW